MLLSPKTQTLWQHFNLRCTCEVENVLKKVIHRNEPGIVRYRVTTHQKTLKVAVDVEDSTSTVTRFAESVPCFAYIFTHLVLNFAAAVTFIDDLHSPAEVVFERHFKTFLYPPVTVELRPFDSIHVAGSSPRGSPLLEDHFIMFGRSLSVYGDVPKLMMGQKIEIKL